MRLPSPSRRAALRTTALGACALALSPVHAAPPPRVVASFSILADMVRQVAPADIEVHSLVGADSDSHAWEPTPTDARRLAQADLVVVNGLGFEGWLARLVQVSGYKGAVVTATQGIQAVAAADEDDAHAHGHGHGHAQGHAPARALDPHAWQDIGLARQYVRNIASALARRWPAREAEITQRRDRYLGAIDALDRQLRALVDSVPRAQRRVLTSHDAFGYLGRAHGIEFLAPQGWNTHSDPSAAAVARLIRQIRQQQVRAVFIENISDRRLVDRIARDTGVSVGGTLYSDALSAPGGPAATYLQLVEHNVRTLVQALRATR